MPTFRRNLHLGTKDPLIETDDLSDGVTTWEKLSDELKKLFEKINGNIAFLQGIIKNIKVQTEIEGKTITINLQIVNEEEAGLMSPEMLDKLNSCYDNLSEEKQFKRVKELQDLAQMSELTMALANWCSTQYQAGNPDVTKEDAMLVANMFLYNDKVRRYNAIYNRKAIVKDKNVNLSSGYHVLAYVDGQQISVTMPKSDTTYIDESIEKIQHEINSLSNSLDIYFNDVAYNSTNKTIDFKHGNSILKSLDAIPFVKDGFLQSVVYDTTNNALVFTFNGEAGATRISVPLSSLLPEETFLTTDSLIAWKNISGKPNFDYSASYLTEHQSISHLQRKIGVVAPAAGANNIVAQIDTHYRLGELSNALTVTLPTVADTSNIHEVTLEFEEGDTVYLPTFISSNDATIHKAVGFNDYTANIYYEISCRWNGSYWVLAKMEYV